MVTFLNEGLPKQTRFFEDERLELLDTKSLSNLIYTHVNTTIKALLGEPNTLTDGFIFRGFDMSTVNDAARIVQVDAVLGVAFDATGRLLIKPATQTAQFTLTDLVDNYIYAYVYDAESDQDGRRRWNRSTSQEDPISDFTRYTPTIGFLNSNTAKTIHNLGGQTVTLIPLFKYTPSGTVSGGTTTDLRQWFGQETAYTFPGDASKGISGLFQLYNAFAKRLNEITGFDWYDQNTNRTILAIENEVQGARSRLSGAPVSADLQTSLIATRRPQITVSTETGKGDYVGAGIVTALTRVDAEGLASGGEVYIKQGTYTDVGTIDFTSSNTRIQGVPNKTILDFGSGVGSTFHFNNVSDVVVEDVVFDTTLTSGEWVLKLTTCTNVKFRNCKFILGSVLTNEFMYLDGCSDITFDQCKFVSLSSTQNMIEFKTGGSGKIKFIGCIIETQGVWLQHVSSPISDLVIRDCNFALEGPSVTIDHVIGLNLSTNSVTAFIDSCIFDDNTFASRYDRVISAYGASHQSFTSGVCINNCQFLDVDSLYAIRINGHNFKSCVTNCYFKEGNPGNAFIEWHALSSDLSIQGEIRDNQFRCGNTYDGIAITSTTQELAKANLHIINNLFDSPKVGIEFLGSPSHVRIQGNTFLSASEAAIQYRSSYGIKNIKISDNKIIGGGTTNVTVSGVTIVCALVLEATAGLLDQCIISGNVIRDFGNAVTAYAVGAILTSGNHHHVLIDGNSIKSVGNVSISSDAHKRTSFRIGCLFRVNRGEFLRISRNSIESAAYGADLYIDVGDNTTTGIGCAIVEVSDNRTSNAPGATYFAAALKCGDEYDEVSFSSASKSSAIDSFSINNNVFESYGNAEGSPEKYQKGNVDIATHKSTGSDANGFFHNIVHFTNNVTKDNQTYIAHLSPNTAEAAVVATAIMATNNISQGTTYTYETTATNLLVTDNLTNV